MANLSDRIKSLRLSADMTQEEFGKKFGIVKSTVSLYESGKSTPNDQLKKQICEYFHVTLDYLLGNSDIKTREDFHNLFFKEWPACRKRIYDRIKALSISKEEFMNSTGIDLEAEISISNLITVATYLNVSIDYLLGRETIDGKDKDNNGIKSFFGYDGDDEDAVFFPHKLANQLDYNNVKIHELAKELGVPEKTIVNWLSGNDTSYTDYYQQLSEFFGVQLRYWTSPRALSPGIEPDFEEYILILLYRNYKEKNILDEKSYGSLESYFPGISIVKNTIENKCLSIFRQLNEDNQDIIIGEMKKCIKEQRYEESVAAEESLKRTGTDNLGK